MPVPVLETPRLRLRGLQPDDAEDIFRLINDFEIVRNLSAVPWPYEREMADAYIAKTAASTGNNEDVSLAITRRGTERGAGHLMGEITLRRKTDCPLFGYWLGKEFWNRGYLSEALGAVVEHAFLDLELERVGGLALPENAASLAVMRKNRFRPDGTVLEKRPNFGDEVIIQRMVLDRAAWAAARRGDER
jgi:8-oxo-dGTP diphosphatase